MTKAAPIRTARRRRAFLEALAETAIVAEACRSAGAARGSFYRWRYEDPDFARAWDLALEEGIATLEDEAVRRARDGVEVPVFYGGKRVDTVRKASDALLMFLLRAHKPKRYCHRTRGAALAARANGGRWGGRDPNSPGAWARLPMPPDPEDGPDIRLPDGRRIRELSNEELNEAYVKYTGKPRPPPPRP